jgi:hypothetical protein
MPLIANAEGAMSGVAAAHSEKTPAHATKAPAPTRQSRRVIGGMSCTFVFDEEMIVASIGVTDILKCLYNVYADSPRLNDGKRVGWIGAEATTNNGALICDVIGKNIYCPGVTTSSGD